MDITIIKNEIKWLLEAIHEEYEAIHGYNGKIPQIEFDILMENVRKFYDDIRILQRLNEPVLQPEGASLPVTAPAGRALSNLNPGKFAAGPARPQTDVSSVSGVTVRYSDHPDGPAPHQLKAEVIPDVPQRAPVQFKPVAPAPIKPEPPIQPKKPVKTQEPDLFAAEEPAFNIKLKNAHERNFSQKPPSRHIENLKAAITINDKFMFINELFDGNLREYNETIETLNGFKDLNQAADFLDLMRKKNFWNTGSTAFKKLSELVEQKF